MFIIELNPSIHFTASIGVAAAIRGEALEALIARADAALYEAKRGRNRVVVAETAVGSPAGTA